MWGGRFPFLSHDKLDPNVYPSPAKQAALPASRCWGEVRGRAGAAVPVRSEHKHLLRAACFSSAQISFVSLRATTR